MKHSSSDCFPLCVCTMYYVQCCMCIIDRSLFTDHISIFERLLLVTRYLLLYRIYYSTHYLNDVFLPSNTLEPFLSNKRNIIISVGLHYIYCMYACTYATRSLCVC